MKNMENKKKRKTKNVKNPNKIFKDFMDSVGKLEYVTTKGTTVENELVLKVNGRVYGYVTPRKSHPFGMQRMVNGHWKTERVTISEQANKLIDSIAEYNDNQKMLQNLKGLGVA